MRQGQSLVMTPQLLQAIKLLQFSSAELSTFIDSELERNPLLERLDTQEAPFVAEPAAASDQIREGDWASDAIEMDPARLAQNLGTGADNAFEGDASMLAPTGAGSEAVSDHGYISAQSWSGTSHAGGAEAPDLDAYVAAPVSLRDHLNAQLCVSLAHPTDLLIGQMLVDAVDDAGYIYEPLDEIATRLGVPLARVDRILCLIQSLDPVGVGARNLAECLSLQLAEKNHLDPAMQVLIANLPLLAKRDFAALRKLCGVDEEDLKDMIAEVRHLDPKPGRAFVSTPVQPVVPDVYVSAASDGTWHVELNSNALPRLLVNQSYAARVARKGSNETDKAFITNCLQTANWLTKSLEQRAKTILKVSSEIVRQQDAFFAQGVEHLRPLNLKTVAAAIAMHESTVSRVTANKYMATPRGMFELKYFFSAAIDAHGQGEAHSAEAVRYKVRQMIQAESADNVLSDDAIVTLLQEVGIGIARRTVAKYRESLHIPSSAERRREKRAMETSQRAGPALYSGNGSSPATRAALRDA